MLLTSIRDPHYDVKVSDPMTYTKLSELSGTCQRAYTDLF